MASPEHLAILKQGVNVWNEWRREHHDIRPDLSRANLSEADLHEVNFTNADLHEANLRHAVLSHADLINADLRDANLQGANLFHAHLLNTNLSRANLTGTNLNSADLNEVTLCEADLQEAELGHTFFGNIDLSLVKGLETVKHYGRSYIDIQTIYCSRGKLSETFLRKAGVPETFITNMRALVESMTPIDFYSCFISYSSKDHEFADRLYTDLQNNGVRCWFAPHDMRVGDKIRPRIDESIRLYDKVLLVLTEHSVASQWVEHEVETALGKELEGKPNVLFPIRLDEKVMESKTGWASHVRLTRHIGDFTNWKSHDDYQQAFNRLLRDLKAGA